jgi:hypothetical protein
MRKRPVPLGSLTSGFASILLSAAVLSCGGGGGPVAGPTSVVPLATPAPPIPQFRDGWTEQAASAEITPAAPQLGDPVAVRAPGYLTRQAPFRGDPFYLWPGEEEFVKQLVYTDTRGGSWPLMRYDRASIVVTPEGEIQNDAAVLAVLAQVAAECTRVTGVPVSVGPNGQVRVIVDPSQALLETNRAAAFTRNSYSGYTIVSSGLYFPEAKWITGATRLTYDNTALHEMGHALGLFHSLDPQDVMFPGYNRQNQELRFSARESVSLKLMYRFRRPGNRPPDRDASLGATQAPETRTAVIVD